MLQSRVQAIPGLNGTNEGTCFYATVYWLYEDLHGVAPTKAVMNNIALDCTFNRVFTDLIVAGSKVSRPVFGSLNLAPGTVLVFVKNGQPGHGCIVKGATAVGGYNQTNWFSTAGLRHSYSEHSPDDISWRGAMNPQEVNVNVVLPPYPPDPKWGALYQIDQTRAKDVLFRLTSTMPAH
jgi:hypothetical protein